MDILERKPLQLSEKPGRSYQYEDLLIAAGGFGLYQLGASIVFTLNLWYFTFQLLFMVFGGLARSDCTTADLNLTGAGNCTGDYEFYSIIPEFGMDESGKTADLVTSILMIGLLIGSPVLSMISDRFGRRRLLLFIGFASTCLVLVRGFSVNWQMFAVITFLIGLMNGGLISINYTYFMELMIAKYRLIYAIIGWTPGCVLLGLYAYGTKDWRILNFAMFSLVVPALVILFFMSESPKYCLARNDTEMAEKIIEKIAKINGVRNFDRLETFQCLEDLQVKEAPKITYTYWHLFHSRESTIGTVIIGFSWINCTLVFFGIIFSLQRLAGSLYINYIITQLFGFLGSVTVSLLDMKFTRITRRIVLITTLVIMTLCMTYCIVAYTTFLHESYPISVTVVAVIGMCANQAAWIPIEVVIPEFYPTELRAMGYGFHYFLTKPFTIAAPHITGLAAIWKPIPFIILTATCVVNTIIAWFWFPETKNKDLADMVTTEGNPLAWCCGKKGVNRDEELMPMHVD